VVRIYARENATQRGNTSTALAGSIAAALREIMLRDLFTVEINSEKRGGHNRDGIGREAILAELRGIPGISDNVVRQQLANLKSSGAPIRYSLVRARKPCARGGTRADRETGSRGPSPGGSARFDGGGG
jgi:hypothetical protein